MQTIYTDKRILPTGPVNSKLLIVGEAGGEDEYDQGIPFVGRVGTLLIECLARNGVSRDEVRLANLSEYRPVHNKFEYLIKTPELSESLEKLHAYIKQYRPNVIAALGNYPLEYLTGKHGITKWRGSILPYIREQGIKVIPTFHPSFVTRNMSSYPIFDLDIKRIINDSHFPEFNLPVRQYVANPRGMELEHYTQLLEESDHLAVDIESIKSTKKVHTNHILCTGFAPNPSLGVSISHDHIEGQSAVHRILNSPAKKTFHFGTFDVTKLKANGFQVMQDEYSKFTKRPYYWDTFLSQHVLAPELPRTLAFLTSIETREPYYKSEGRGEIPDDAKEWTARSDKRDLFIYNCKDVCTTSEIRITHEKEILNTPFEHTFNDEMRKLTIAHHIGDNGMYRDEERRALLEKALLKKWGMLQFFLNNFTGYKVNVNSTTVVPKILYDKDKLGLPVKRNRDGGLTADEDAIVSLIAYCKGHIQGLKRAESIQEWTVKLKVLGLILEIRGIRKLLSTYIRAHPSSDNRIRSLYKVGGTETGRWSCSAYMDATGYNMQTNPRDPFEFDPDTLDTQFDPELLLSQLNEDEKEEEDAA